MNHALRLNQPDSSVLQYCCCKPITKILRTRAGQLISYENNLCDSLAAAKHCYIPQSTLCDRQYAEMDPLYTSERASRKRVWNDLLELDAEARRNMKEPREEGLRPPLSIIMVDRDGESDFSELLELCYRSVSFVM